MLDALALWLADQRERAALGWSQTDQLDALARDLA